MTIGYKFPLLDQNGTATTTYVDMDDMFVPKYIAERAGLYAWGYNVGGLISPYSGAHRSFATKVGSSTNWKRVSANYNNTAAIKTDGTLWTTYPGVGTAEPGTGLYLINSPTTWSEVCCSTEYTTHAIKTDGTLWAWGLYNTNGELGDGTTTNSQSSPVQIGTLTNWKFIAECRAIKTDGTLWTWGYNALGQLGLNDRTHRSSPVQVGSLTNWKQINAGYYSTAAIKTDGTLWTWGGNSYGQLGLGDLVHRSSPVQVGALTNWSQVGAGAIISGAVKTDGTLWTWGIYSTSPTQFGSLTNWKQVGVSGNQGKYTWGMLKTDGTIWTYGYGGYSGALGNGITGNDYFAGPVQVINPDGTGLENYYKFAVGQGPVEYARMIAIAK